MHCSILHLWDINSEQRYSNWQSVKQLSFTKMSPNFCGNWHTCTYLLTLFCIDNNYFSTRGYLFEILIHVSQTTRSLPINNKWINFFCSLKKTSWIYVGFFIWMNIELDLRAHLMGFLLAKGWHIHAVPRQRLHAKVCHLNMISGTRRIDI